MSLMIYVADELAQRLHAEAANQQLSPEALALAILDDVVPQPAGNSWGSQNQRRVELIRKSSRCELTPVERAELDQLQGWLDKRFAEFDTGLHQQLSAWKQLAAQFGPTHE